MSTNQSPFSLNDLSDYYDILGIKPDASPTEIREAYIQAKSTYQKDNVALYTLIDGEEREDMLKRIEEAYQVLSNPERRRHYDSFYGQLNASPFNIPSEPSDSGKVISIERPFGADPSRQPAATPSSQARSPFESSIMDPYVPPVRREPSALQTPEPFSQASPPPAAPSSQEKVAPAGLPAGLEQEIREQTDWSGSFLRRVREARGISLEEVMLATRISKAYILAIEEENYAKLPAAVFIRGFVSQIARLLKLPQKEVAVSYISRLQRNAPEKFK